MDTTRYTELRRGLLEFLILAIVASGDAYAGDILERLQDTDFATREGTLYPLLRRMEEQGLLESWWVTEQARPRKYYRTTADGRDCLRVLVETWSRVDASLRKILAAAAEAPPTEGQQAPPSPGTAPGGEGDADGQ